MDFFIGEFLSFKFLSKKKKVEFHNPSFVADLQKDNKSLISSSLQVNNFILKKR